MRRMTGHGLSKCTRYATNGTNDDGPAKPAQWHSNSNGSVPYNTTLAVMKLDDEASCNGSLPRPEDTSTELKCHATRRNTAEVRWSGTGDQWNGMPPNDYS